MKIDFQNRKTRFVQVLYDHTLPVLLELGCDSNSVVRQIFKELTFQIIHWQTSRTKESFILQHIMVSAHITSRRCSHRVWIHSPRSSVINTLSFRPDRTTSVVHILKLERYRED